MKKRHVVLIVLLILFFDQWFKFYIKTNYYLGQDVSMIGEWFRLHFVENEGMAWGWKLGESGSIGKLALTIFRMVAVAFGVYYIAKIVREKQHPLFIACVGLIFAGAAGNLIDSMFYGMLFEASDPYTQNIARFLPEGGGYAGFLHGKVVDMLYFPIYRGAFPSWFPFWGGEPFEFFAPVFNIADASISIGLILILIFQKKIFKEDSKPNPAVETNSEVSDLNQIM